MNNYFLYAEDDQDDADILNDILRVQQCTTGLVRVTNGYELLQYLQQVKTNAAYPCLIILDLKLPRLNGIETLKLLRTDDMFRLIPVAILSSKISSKDESACKKLGAEVLQKPNNYAQWSIVLSHLTAYADEI